MPRCAIFDICLCLGQVWAGSVLHGEAVQVSRGGEHQGEHGQGAQAAHQRGYDHRGESIHLSALAFDVNFYYWTGAGTQRWAILFR